MTINLITPRTLKFPAVPQPLALVPASCRHVHVRRVFQLRSGAGLKIKTNVIISFFIPRFLERNVKKKRSIKFSLVSYWLLVKIGFLSIFGDVLSLRFFYRHATLKAQGNKIYARGSSIFLIISEKVNG